MGTKEDCKMMKIIQTLEEGRVPARERSIRDLLTILKRKVSWHKKACGTLKRKKTLMESGELPKEEGGAVREYKAVHEENFLSSWLREDVRGKEERAAKAGQKNEEERCEKRKREEEKEENQTGRIKRRRDGLFSEILSWGRFGELWWSFLGGLLGEA